MCTVGKTKRLLGTVFLPYQVSSALESLPNRSHTLAVAVPTNSDEFHVLVGPRRGLEDPVEPMPEPVHAVYLRHDADRHFSITASLHTFELFLDAGLGRRRDEVAKVPVDLGKGLGIVDVRDVVRPFPELLDRPPDSRIPVLGDVKRDLALKGTGQAIHDPIPSERHLTKCVHHQAGECAMLQV